MAPLSALSCNTRHFCIFFIYDVWFALAWFYCIFVAFALLMFTVHAIVISLAIDVSY